MSKRNDISMTELFPCHTGVQAWVPQIMPSWTLQSNHPAVQGETRCIYHFNKTSTTGTNSASLCDQCLCRAWQHNASAMPLVATSRPLPPAETLSVPALMLPETVHYKHGNPRVHPPHRNWPPLPSHIHIHVMWLPRDVITPQTFSSPRKRVYVWP